MKSNPNPELMRRLRQFIGLVDVSSGGELKRALEVGWTPELITFTGPGKRDQELEEAVSSRIGGVIVESLNEAKRLAAIASRRGVRQDVLVRIAPRKLPRGFGVNMAGKPTQFGIDEEDVDAVLPLILKLPALRLRGLHIYSGTQCLSSDAIAENIEIHKEVFIRCAERHDLRPELLIFGSGFGIPYYENDRPLDVTAVARRVKPALDELKSRERFRTTRLVLEMGRYLVGEAGFYLTGVVDRKSSRGTEICICDGGMNHHLGACGHLGSVIHRNYRMFKVTGGADEIPQAEYDLVGPLCTSIDTLGHRVKLPSLDIGDVIAVRCSGAYGPSASPVFFIHHPPPKEILVERVGDAVVLRDISDPSP